MARPTAHCQKLWCVTSLAAVKAVRVEGTGEEPVDGLGRARYLLPPQSWGL